MLLEEKKGGRDPLGPSPKSAYGQSLNIGEDHSNVDRCIESGDKCNLVNAYKRLVKMSLHFDSHHLKLLLQDRCIILPSNITDR